MGAIHGLVIEKGLMEQLPEVLFTQRIVRHMSPETLELVAGETEDTARQRIECEEELKGLEECLEKLTRGGNRYMI
jgi:predicted nucleic acid-binding protein